MQFKQRLHIRSTIRAHPSCLTNPVLSYYYILEPSLNACNEDPRSLFVKLFGQCLAKLLVLNHKGYFTSGFPSQLNPLSLCLTRDLSFLERFSWLLSLMDLGSRFPCEEGFLMRLSSISCAQLESPNMLSYLFYFHGLAPIM